VVAAVEIYAQAQTLKRQVAARGARDGQGTRPPSLQKSYETQPETPVAE
jgi:hypothetical protein